MRVRDPQGQTWRVTRRWVPWRPRPRAMRPQLLIESADGVAGLVAGLVIGLVVLPVLTFLLLSGGEFVLLALVLPFAIGGRALFGQHWWIETRLGFRPHWEEEAGDWRASGLRIHQIASAIERGDPPLRNLGSEEGDDSERSSGRNPA